MRRILQVLGRSAGGIAQHVAFITARLNSMPGISVDVAGPDDLPVEMPVEILPVNIPSGAFGGHRRAIARLRGLIVDGNYDVVHAHGLRAGIDASRAARSGPRVVMTVHNLVLPEIKGRFKATAYRVAEPLAVRLVDRTLAVSEDIASRLRAAGGRNVETLYLGVAEPRVTRPAAEVRAEAEVPEEGRLVVSASRLRPQKSLDVMIRAVASLPSEVVLAILGEGPLEGELRSLAAQSGVEKRVRWLGWRRDAADWIAAADVFCLSSVWEGIPLAAQEAMLVGTPVVATAVGGMTEIVTSGETGRLVPHGDAGALASALDDVLYTPELAAALAAAAGRQVRARFSTERMLAGLVEAYRANDGR